MGEEQKSEGGDYTTQAIQVQSWTAQLFSSHLDLDKATTLPSFCIRDWSLCFLPTGLYPVRYTS